MDTPVITLADVPTIGVPTGVKEAGKRVDFKPTEFDLMIETKGYLLAWSRASICPCAPIDTTTEQNDPNCTLCKGKGWYYFGTYDNQDIDAIGTFTDVQKRIITDNNALLIRGIITGVQNTYTPYDKIGNWANGSMNVTVRQENRLGYYDRLVALDTHIVFSEIVFADGSLELSTRYYPITVNHLRTSATIYKIGTDFAIINGVITWYSGHEPTVGTRLSVHYLCHPTWLIMDHPHNIRTTLVKYKSSNTTTVAGSPVNLPIQATARYEFLEDR